jgi:hypothetical protein
MKPVTVSALLAEMGELVRALGARLLGAWALLIGAGMVTDTMVEPGITGLFTIATSILQLVLTVVIVRRGFTAMGIERDGGAGIGGLFLIAIPLNLGVALGLLLLILPGFYLAARWRIAVPRLLSSDGGIFEAIGFSRERTKPHWLPLMLATMLVAIPMILAVVPFGLAEEEGAMPLPLSAVANALVYAGILVGLLLDLAAYRLIADPTDDLTRTFA